MAQDRILLLRLVRPTPGRYVEVALSSCSAPRAVVLGWHTAGGLAGQPGKSLEVKDILLRSSPIPGIPKA
eukprot:93557-Amphidinium_carterae.1